MYYSGVECDVCGRRVDLGMGASKSTMTRLARQRGWAVGKQTIESFGREYIVEKTTCPECRSKKKT